MSFLMLFEPVCNMFPETCKFINWKKNLELEIRNSGGQAGAGRGMRTEPMALNKWKLFCYGAGGCPSQILILASDWKHENIMKNSVNISTKIYNK